MIFVASNKVTTFTNIHINCSQAFHSFTHLETVVTIVIYKPS